MAWESIMFLKNRITKFVYRALPSKSVTEIFVPWLKFLAASVGAIFALWQYSQDVQSRKLKQTYEFYEEMEKKLIPQSTSEKTLHREVMSLLTITSRAIDDDPRILDMTKRADEIYNTVIESEKIANPSIDTLESVIKMKQDLEKMAVESNSLVVKIIREKIVKEHALEGRYEIVYEILQRLITCSETSQCHSGAVSKLIDADVFNFVNGACGYFDILNERWNVKDAGFELFLYVIENRIYLRRKREARPNPFFCAQFREIYESCWKISIPYLYRDIFLLGCTETVAG